METKPKLSDLQHIVKPLVATQWEEVGIALYLADNDDGEQLDRVRENRSGESSMCFNDTMKLWLRSGVPEVTWAALIKAIKSIDGLKGSGAKIEAQLLSSSKQINFIVLSASVRARMHFFISLLSRYGNLIKGSLYY